MTGIQGLNQYFITICPCSLDAEIRTKKNVLTDSDSTSKSYPLPSKTFSLQNTYTHVLGASPSLKT